jgi:FkbM family methyltransferase
MKILYGVSRINSIDVTERCMSKLTLDNVIRIPSGDNARSLILTDPYPGILKRILISFDDKEFEIYDHFNEVNVDLSNNIIETFNVKELDTKLKNIHSKLQFNNGSLIDELPQQKMIVRTFSGNEKVLEIGSNIGRNSLVIASILQNLENFVTLESDTTIAEQLKNNRDLNNFNFYIENSTLSERKLIQKDLDTIPSEVLLDGYNWVNTISLVELQNKYNIEFDTLVLDCGSVFYYILMDMPEILNNIKLIVMENDYLDISHKNYIDVVLKSKDFNRYYIEAGGSGLCYDNFLEIWKKI